MSSKYCARHSCAASPSASVVEWIRVEGNGRERLNWHVQHVEAYERRQRVRPYRSHKRAKQAQVEHELLRLGVLMLIGLLCVMLTWRR